MSSFSAPPTPSYADATGTSRTAKLVSDVLSPGFLVIAVLLIVGWRSTSSARGVAWGLLAAVFCGFVPLGIIYVGVRRGSLTDRHVRVRRQRIPPLVGSLVSVLTGLALLVACDAPTSVFAATVSMLVGLLSTLLVTLRWQISVHSAVAMGTMVIVVPGWGWWLLVVAPLVLAVAWSRLALKAHTPAQVCCGTLLGMVTSLLFHVAR